MGIICNVTATSRAARCGFRAHFTFFGGGALGIGRDFLSFAISLVCGDGNPCPSAMALMMFEKLPFSGLCIFFGRVMLLAMYFICPFAWDNAISNGYQISLTTASCPNSDIHSLASR